MRSETETGVSNLDAYNRWTPAARERALQLLAERQRSEWRPFWCQNRTCPGTPHDEWTWNHARPDQRPPTDPDWLVWLLKSGRGSGKTRTGAEATNRIVTKVPRIALIGSTAADVRDTMLEGQSGIITVAKPGQRPIYEPSKRRLTWPNGAIGTVFSAEEPDRLRGPEHYYAWADEPAHWPLVQSTWDMLMFGLRLGQHPRVIVTTTPKPKPWLKTLMAEPTTRMSVASTYDNLANLSPVFAQRIIAKYAGTRLGRQELDAEVLQDVEGALWDWDMLSRATIEPEAAPDQYERIVVGVDPAGSSNRKSDETGICVVGRANNHLYLLADRSGVFSPNGWATRVLAAYEEFSADAIVAETNYGGEMVTNTIRTLAGPDSSPRVLPVNSRRGKVLRAEPIVALYEQDRFHHVGVFDTLTTQQSEWVPSESTDSPDRVDALVHAATELVKTRGVTGVANPANLDVKAILAAARGDSGAAGLRVIRGGAA